MARTASVANEPLGPVLVGELNPYGSDPRYALWPSPPRASGARLRDILDLSIMEYVRLPRFNLCSGSWHGGDAVKRAQEIEAAHAGRVLVLLGAKVRDAFGIVGGAFERVENCVLVPHPSGLCRAWNDPDAAMRARSLIRDALPEWAAYVWGP